MKRAASVAENMALPLLTALLSLWVRPEPSARPPLRYDWTLAPRRAGRQGQSERREDTHVRDHRGGKPAETVVAGRTGPAVGTVAPSGRRAGGGQARRHPA